METKVSVERILQVFLVFIAISVMLIMVAFTNIDLTGMATFKLSGAGEEGLSPLRTLGITGVCLAAAAFLAWKGKGTEKGK